MNAKSKSIGINKWAGNQSVEMVGSVGEGDAKLILWRRADGAEAIETNGDPVWEGQEGFAEAREQITR